MLKITQVTLAQQNFRNLLNFCQLNPRLHTKITDNDKINRFMSSKTDLR